MSACPRCGGRQWTCEAHPDQPFEHKLENGEICPGPGDPCVECNLLSHDIDSGTMYCVWCGAAEQDIVDRKLDCISDRAKVNAVSHLIAKRRFEVLLQMVRK